MSEYRKLPCIGGPYDGQMVSVAGSPDTVSLPVPAIDEKPAHFATYRLAPTTSGDTRLDYVEEAE